MAEEGSSISVLSWTLLFVSLESGAGVRVMLNHSTLPLKLKQAGF